MVGGRRGVWGIIVNRTMVAASPRYEAVALKPYFFVDTGIGALPDLARGVLSTESHGPHRPSA